MVKTTSAACSHEDRPLKRTFANLNRFNTEFFRATKRLSQDRATSPIAKSSYQTSHGFSAQMRLKDVNSFAERFELLFEDFRELRRTLTSVSVKQGTDKDVSITSGVHQSSEAPPMTPPRSDIGGDTPLNCFDQTGFDFSGNCTPSEPVVNEYEEKVRKSVPLDDSRRYKTSAIDLDLEDAELNDRSSEEPAFVCPETVEG